MMNVCGGEGGIVIALLRSLSGKYPRERYESHYPPSYGLKSTTTENSFGIK